VLQLTL